MLTYFYSFVSFIFCSFLVVETPIADRGCVITIEEITVLNCNDNGTPTDPTDDFYQVFVNASVIQGSAANTFSVQINGTVLGTHEYDLGGKINVPFNNNNTTLTFTDTDDLTCTTSDVLGPLPSCSDDCPVTLEVLHTPILTGTFQASDTVISCKRVKKGHSVIFQAGNCIELPVGFHVESNGEFEAKILDCSN